LYQSGNPLTSKLCVKSRRTRKPRVGSIRPVSATHGRECEAGGERKARYLLLAFVLAALALDEVVSRVARRWRFDVRFTRPLLLRVDLRDG
jgi:hypothetical protein